MLNIHKPQCWAVGRLRTLLRKQAGWKLKAEQLFLSNSQHRQVVSCKQQTTCPVHWSSSERRMSSALLTAFLAALGSWWCSPSLGEHSGASKPSPTSTWLTSTHPFLQPCQHQARWPRAETQGTWRTTAKPRHDHHICRTRPACPAEDTGLQWRACKLLSRPARHLPKRPLPCSSPLTGPSPHNTYPGKPPFLRL